jgi:uncharacterized iron-regulated membrane protein
MRWSDPQSNGNLAMFSSHANPEPASVVAPSHVKSHWAEKLIRRLHTWIGVVVAPFLLIAVITGLAYVWTPQIEAWWYRSVLHTPSQGQALSLHHQVQAALDHVQGRWPLVAVRPALEPGQTTRVIFSDSSLGEGERWAVFVDPVTARVLGTHVVYGTSGALPLRLWSSKLHRQLLAGENGRLYSELAASWLWVAALGGVYLWWAQRRRQRAAAALKSLRARHARWGLMLLLGLLFLAASGLTWSRFAGDNIGQWRRAMGWATPALELRLEPRDLGGVQADALPPHQVIDAVWQVAQRFGIDASRVEIRPPTARDKAWSVIEIDRRWPTQVDAVAIDGRTLEPVHAIAFQDFPLAAKLTRWAVDLHMGVMFGWPNQVALSIVGVGLLMMIVWGYRMWWRHRSGFFVEPTIWGALGQAPWAARVLIVVVGVALGWALPVLGASLALFAFFDAIAPWIGVRRGAPAMGH